MQLQIRYVTNNPLLCAEEINPGCNPTANALPIYKESKNRDTRESVNRSQMEIKRKTCDIQNWKKNIYFSTYPPPTLIRLSNRFTSASKPTAQKS
jgi:hypothetical protein